MKSHIYGELISGERMKGETGMELRKERNHRTQPAFYPYHLQDLIDNYDGFISSPNVFFLSLPVCYLSIFLTHSLSVFSFHKVCIFFPIQLLSSLSKLKHKCKYFCSWYFICAAAVTMACLKCTWSNTVLLLGHMLA